MSSDDPFSSARLTRYPAPATPGEYKEAARELERALLVLPGLVGLYRLGAVSVPGISDIDRIAVVEPMARPPKIWPTLSARTRWLAMHGPFLVDVETFRWRGWFAHLEPLELVRGDSIEPVVCPYPAERDRLLGAESLALGVLRLFKQAALGRVKVRSALCELNNVRHGLRLSGVTRAQAARAWEIADEVEDLRQSWFRLPGGSSRDATVRRLMARSGPALLKALESLPAEAGPGRQEGVALRLSAPWSNVTIVPARENGQPGAAWRQPRWRDLFSLSGRMAELRWRMVRWRLPLPGPAVTILSAQGAAEPAFERRRAEVLAGYRAFLNGRERSYSPIGLGLAHDTRNLLRDR